MIVGPIGLLFSAATGNLSPVNASSFSSSFASGVQTISVNKSDIGNPTQINLGLAASGDTGATTAEFAPDSGVWNYQITLAPPPPPPPPPLKLTARAPHLSKAQAGQLFSASIVVTNSSTGKGVKGTVTCAARAGGKPLAALRHTSTAGGTATCAWRLPSTAHGKLLTGTITDTYKGKRGAGPSRSRSPEHLAPTPLAANRPLQTRGRFFSVRARL